MSNGNPIIVENLAVLRHMLTSLDDDDFVKEYLRCVEVECGPDGIARAERVEDDELFAECITEAALGDEYLKRALNSLVLKCLRAYRDGAK